LNGKFTGKLLYLLCLELELLTGIITAHLSDLIFIQAKRHRKIAMVQENRYGQPIQASPKKKWRKLLMGKRHRGNNRNIPAFMAGKLAAEALILLRSQFPFLISKITSFVSCISL